MQGTVVMDALILSCSTGGGHNAAGIAVKEELKSRGHHVEMMDPYELIGTGLEEKISSVYIKTVQKIPFLFGFIYLLGEGYRRLPFHSPVYLINKKMAGVMQQYLSKHHYDVVIMPHLFPAEILSYMKQKGMEVPQTVFIATDYSCIPFTEETDCDYYIIPGEGMKSSFIKKGINEERIKTFGIPVKKGFEDECVKKTAKISIQLKKDEHYILISGGSMGAGKIYKTICILCKAFADKSDMKIIVICGNNEILYKKVKQKLERKYPKKLLVLKSTSRMACYMKACDVFISKPGGLSSTEAATAGIPLIHISPIPGCETHNMKYFERYRMNVAVRKLKKELLPAVKQLTEKEKADVMKGFQHAHVNICARRDICDWLEIITKDKTIAALDENSIQ